MENKVSKETVFHIADKALQAQKQFSDDAGRVQVIGDAIEEALALSEQIQIKLNPEEIVWIKLIKGHYNDTKYKKMNIPMIGWIDALKVHFNQVYDWKAADYYDDFLDCMFSKLLDIYIKIQYDQSGHNMLIKEIIKSGFKQEDGDYDLPVERAIASLCHGIRFNQVKVNGVPRYSLDEAVTEQSAVDNL